MKLLIVTQIIDRNDPILGFFHRWVIEFAKHCERVTVICLKEGQHELPENVRVLSLGKERFESRSDPGLVIPAEAGIQRRPLQATPPAEDTSEATSRSGLSSSTRSRMQRRPLQPTPYNLPPRLLYTLRFLRLIWRERKHYDAVFVHMNPEYIILGAPLWRMLRKRIALWYTHGSVTLTLRIATFLTHTVFTASKESFRIESPKVRVVGHGIDTELFRPPAEPNCDVEAGVARLISVGRISRVKRQDLAIQTLSELKRRGVDATLTLVGVPLTEADVRYEEELKALAEKEGVSDRVIWRGPVANAELPQELAKATILLHTSETGSLDKVVLEAMAVGLFVVSTSTAVGALVSGVGKLFVGVSPCPNLLGQKVSTLLTESSFQAEARQECLQIVRLHELQSLVRKIARTISLSSDMMLP